MKKRERRRPVARSGGVSRFGPRRFPLPDRGSPATIRRDRPPRAGRPLVRTRRLVALASLGLGLAALVLTWDDLVPKRRAVVEPGRILRGAWPRPGPLLRLARHEGVRTVVTLTAINRDDPKYVA